MKVFSADVSKAGASAKVHFKIDLGGITPAASRDDAQILKLQTNEEFAVLKRVNNPLRDGEYSLKKDSTSNNLYELTIVIADYTGIPGAVGSKDWNRAQKSILDPIIATVQRAGVRGGNSSGRCNSLYAPFALLLAAPLFFMRKKK